MSKKFFGSLVLVLVLGLNGLAVFAQEGPPASSDPNPTGYQGGGSSRLPYIGDLFRAQLNPGTDDASNLDGLSPADANVDAPVEVPAEEGVVEPVIENPAPVADAEAMPIGLPSAGMDSIVDLMALSVLVSYLIFRDKILA